MPPPYCHGYTGGVARTLLVLLVMAVTLSANVAGASSPVEAQAKNRVYLPNANNRSGGTAPTPVSTPIATAPPSPTTTATPAPFATPTPAPNVPPAAAPVGGPPMLDGSLVNRKDFIYGSEIGGWWMLDNRYDGHYMLNYKNSCPTCPQLAEAAKIPVVRWMPADVFTDETRPNGTPGNLPRAQFDNVVDGIRAMGAHPFLKLFPAFTGNLNGVDGKQFCTTGAGNLPYYKEIIRQAGTRVQLYESTNEMDWVCGYNYTTAGTAVAQHWINNVPAMKKYARSLGFEIYVGGPAMTNIGGLKWGDTIANPGMKPTTDFLQTIKNEYENPASPYYHDPDLIPTFYSFHSYATDCSGNGFTTLDCVNYYAAFVDKTRSEINRIWGPTIGPRIQVADSEWNLAQDGPYAGWATAEATNFYGAMLQMFRQHNVWLANQFLMASNGNAMDMITENGQVTPYYNVFKGVSLADPLR